MSKYHVVHAVPIHSDDFEVVAIFSKGCDAADFIAAADEGGDYIKGSAASQHLTMPVILDLLAKDRLKELYDPIMKLVNGAA